MEGGEGSGELLTGVQCTLGGGGRARTPVHTGTACINHSISLLFFITCRYWALRLKVDCSCFAAVAERKDRGLCIEHRLHQEHNGAAPTPPGTQGRLKPGALTGATPSLEYVSNTLGADGGSWADRLFGSMR
eukprot:1147666-Pelagomonas_calceolata.AAC.4